MPVWRSHGRFDIRGAIEGARRRDHCVTFTVWHRELDDGDKIAAALAARA